MKIIDNVLKEISNESFLFGIAGNKGVFLDIETTGLKKESCTVYLIGLIFQCPGKDGNIWQQRLFFAEAPSDEILLLREFSSFAFGLDGIRLITYNGSRFDLPFLKKRYEVHGIPCPACLSSGNDIDIYKDIRPYRRSFGLSSLNQKSVEKMLGIKREDKYTGEELIAVYKDFVKTKDPELFHRLITHNREDVLGLTEILPVLSYSEIFRRAASEKCPDREYEIISACLSIHTGFDGQDCPEFIIEFRLPLKVPVPHLFHNFRLFLETDDTLGRLRIPVKIREMKHFFNNYRDYCYLRDKDMAVLKEIAMLMDSEMTEKASPDTCYIRSEGIFLPLPGDFSFSGFPEYRTERKSRQKYLLYTDEIINSPELNGYLKHILSECFASSHTFS